MRPKVWIPLALIAGCIVVYSRSANNDFVNYDDPDYITNNPHVRAGVTSEGFRWSLISVREAKNWHPVTWWSHMADVQVFGMNPGGHHISSIALHALNAVLVFWLLERMTGALWPAAFVAAVFAVHPLNVESVAWASQRKTLLCTTFWLLSIWAYVVYAEKKGVGRYLLVILLGLLALASKPMAVTLPFVLLLLDYWPLRRWNDGSSGARTAVRRLAEKAPLFLAAALAAALTYRIQGTAMTSVAALPIYQRLSNSLVAYATYPLLLVWPRGLAVLYPHPMPAIEGSKAWASLIFLGIVTLVSFRQRFVRPYLIVGWLWYLGTLVPMIGLVQVGRQAMADRYAYIPMLGLLIMVAWGAADLTVAWSQRALVLTVGSTAALAALALTSFLQVGYWRDSLALFDRALAVTERNGVAHYLKAVRLDELGDRSGAIENIREALRISPWNDLAHVALATFYWKNAQREEALKEYNFAVELRPDVPEHLFRRGAALIALGRLREGAVDVEKAVQLDPNNVDAVVELGAAMVQLQRAEDARLLFERALLLNPASEAAHNGMGALMAQRGRFEEARMHLDEAMRLNPNSPATQRNLALLYLRKGEPAQALTIFDKLQAENPSSVEYELDAADALTALNRTKEATERLRQAAEKQKDNIPIRSRLAQLYFAAKDWPAAEKVLRELLALRPANSLRIQLAEVLLAQHRTTEAIELYRTVLRDTPNNQVAANNLAWHLATNPSPEARSSQEAVILAIRVCEQTNYKLPGPLDTLAAAYADSGRYAEAVDVAKQARDLAKVNGEEKLAAMIEDRIKLYESKKPYRTAPTP